MKPVNAIGDGTVRVSRTSVMWTALAAAGGIGLTSTAFADATSEAWLRVQARVAGTPPNGFAYLNGDGFDTLAGGRGSGSYSAEASEFLDVTGIPPNALVGLAGGLATAKTFAPSGEAHAGSIGYSHALILRNLAANAITIDIDAEWWYGLSVVLGDAGRDSGLAKFDFTIINGTTGAELLRRDDFRTAGSIETPRLTWSFPMNLPANSDTRLTITATVAADALTVPAGGAAAVLLAGVVALAGRRRRSAPLEA